MEPPIEMRTYRGVWLSTCVTALVLGWGAALVTHPVSATFWTFVATAILGALGTIMYRLADDHAPMPVPTLFATAGRYGVGFGATIVALTGFLAFVGGWTLPVMGLIALGSPRLIEWVRRQHAEPALGPENTAPAEAGLGSPGPGTRSGRVGHEPVHPPEPAPPSPTTPVCSMATPDLCRAWRRSFLELQGARTCCARAKIVVLRQAYLDELERRNRPGFESWLESGARAASDPGRYLGPRHDQDH